MHFDIQKKEKKKKYSKLMPSDDLDFKIKYSVYNLKKNKNDGAKRNRVMF